MDQYDRVIRDIQQKTADDVLGWKVVPPGSLPTLAVYARRIASAYRADYVLGEATYALLFLGRSVDSIDEFTNEPTDYVVFELLVLGPQGEVVLRLYSGVVETKDLYRLASLIEGHNVQATNFFSAFEKAFATGAEAG